MKGLSVLVTLFLLVLADQLAVHLRHAALLPASQTAGRAASSRQAGPDLQTHLVPAAGLVPAPLPTIPGRAPVTSWAWLNREHYSVE